MARNPLSRTVIERLRARRAAEAKWAEFISWAQRRQSPRWVFRGHSQRWTLKPLIGRSDRYLPEVELQILQAFRRSAVPYVDRSSLASNWDWLALAQHHGLPTRLLDWTTNPLVAAFFASEASVRDKRDGYVIAIDTREIHRYHPDDPDELDPIEIEETGFLYPPALVSRIISQRGLFSIHPMPTDSWRPRKAREEFVIPAEMKEPFRRALFGLGIDSSFLMADLDGLSSTLKWRFENRIPFE